MGYIFISRKLENIYVINYSLLLKFQPGIVRSNQSLKLNYLITYTIETNSKLSLLFYSCVVGLVKETLLIIYKEILL